MRAILEAAPAGTAALRVALRRWYRARRRELPWRGTRDSFRIWVAETMLQQTRIAAVVPAYRRFVRAFPDLRRFAAAPEDAVMSLWSGLGYYARARNLHRAARRLVAEGHDEFPRDAAAALALPGVGTYTAAAVLSIAYDVPLAAVDGNVVRVLSRLFRLSRPDSRGMPHARHARELLDARRPGDWNQAMMELGQTVCLPRRPNCQACPLRRGCEARRRGEVDRFPPKRPRPKGETVLLDVVVIRDRRGQILLERGAFPHLRHLWLPLTCAGSDGARQPAGFRRLQWRGEFRHAILHRTFRVHVYERVAAAGRGRVGAGAKGTGERRWFDPAELQTIGRSALLAKALACVSR